MSDDEISEAGRQTRFAQWDEIGLDEIKHDLLSGGHRLIGGPPAVRKLAREWVRMKEAGVASNSSQPARAPSRQIVISAADILKALGHSGFDRLLLEFDLPDKEAGRGSGLMARATSLSNFAFQHPETLTAEGKPIAEAIVERAAQLFRETGAMSSNVSDTERRTFMTIAARDGVSLHVSNNPKGDIVKRDATLMLHLIRSIEEGNKMSWKDLTVNMSDTERENALAHINLLAEDALIKGMSVSIQGHKLWQDLELTSKGHDYLEQHSMRAVGAQSQPVSAYSRKVFIVHGHDNEAKQEVARFLERIGFEAVILHEQASRNRTVIEKVEAHGDVGFAVVIFTPDDVGYVKGGTPVPRARQNVVLELGYFVGRLTRERVCVLRRGEVEIPSDFGGVVYEPFDEHGAWKSKLAKELEAADYAINWQKVHA